MGQAFSSGSPGPCLVLCWVFFFLPPEGEGLPREDGGFFFFSFPSTRRENEAETRWGAREGTRRGEGGGDRGPAWREAAERGGRLASVCGSSGTSAMVAEPRGCCADPPPTPRSGPAHLAVSRLATGASGRDVSEERANGGREAGLGAGVFAPAHSSIFFYFFFSSLFLSFFFFLIK